MNTTEIATLKYKAQNVADCALLAYITGEDRHEKELKAALAKFDEARAALTEAQAPEPVGVRVHCFRVENGIAPMERGICIKHNGTIDWTTWEPQS